MLRQLPSGIWRENPLLLCAAGLCPALAVSTRLAYALGMSAVVLVVFLLTLLIMALLEPRLPELLRLPLTLLVAAGLVTGCDLLLRAVLPSLRAQLGIYVQLVAVNCLLTGRCLAGSGSLSETLRPALGQAGGYCLALLLLAAVREVLGAGTLTLFPAGSFSGVLRGPGLAEQPAGLLLLAPGALLLLGYLSALLNGLRVRRERS